MSNIESRPRPPHLWKPGQSGNPKGRPTGGRNKFSDAFYRDIAATWAKYGTNALDTVARDEPAKFLAVCASIIPKDVSLTLTARLPGNLEPDEWELALEILEAIKIAVPGAEDRKPGDVLQFALEAIRSHGAVTIENGGHEKTESQITLSAIPHDLETEGPQT